MYQLLSRLLVLRVVFSLVVINRMRIENNYKIINYTSELFSDNKSDSRMNAEFEIFHDLSPLMLMLKINIANDYNDFNYRREFLHSTFDLFKTLNQTKSSIIVKAFLENFSTAFKFPLVYPFKRVSRCFIDFKNLILFLSGTLQDRKPYCI